MCVARCDECRKWSMSSPIGPIRQCCSHVIPRPILRRAGPGTRGTTRSYGQMAFRVSYWRSSPMRSRVKRFAASKSRKEHRVLLWRKPRGPAWHRPRAAPGSSAAPTPTSLGIRCPIVFAPRILPTGTFTRHGSIGSSSTNARGADPARTVVSLLSVVYPRATSGYLSRASAASFPQRRFSSVRTGIAWS